MIGLSEVLGLQDGASPFPWQQTLLAKLESGIQERVSLDIPTGLGKTSVMAAWLLAKSRGGNLPTRLAYVVDRRAVVDQASREAARLRAMVNANDAFKKSIGLQGDQCLAISTLRGQFADNRQWLSDPSMPAIIVGTVDMIGSRLLFEGYGVSRRMRPYHAGFLGADTLFVLDEAHLVPPFEALLRQVVEAGGALKGEESTRQFVPRSVFISLSATGRESAGPVMQLSNEDLGHQVAGQRLRATKKLRFLDVDEDGTALADRIAAAAWKLSDEGAAKKRFIVFCNSRKNALKVEKAVRKHAGDNGKHSSVGSIHSQLFVGARRIRERQRLEDWLEEHGFLAGAQTTLDKPAFVFATSAGEVGVDLDADHMIGDLVAFERMVQRFGRVNRRGTGDAEIHVVSPRNQPDEKEAAALAKALAKSYRQRGAKDHALVWQFDRLPKYRAALESLPEIAGDTARDASPEALRQLKLDAVTDARLSKVLEDATTPAPLRPELTRPILDSWSMTSLKEHAARPIVAPWLRGWVDDEPQTTIVWRKYLPTVSSTCTDEQICEYFEAAPIHLTEKLETTSSDVLRWLLKRVEKIGQLRDKLEKTGEGEIANLPSVDEVVAIVLSRSGDVVRRLLLNDLERAVEQGKKEKDKIGRVLEDCTLIVDVRCGGMACSNGVSVGVLDEARPADEFADAADGVPFGEWIGANDDKAEPVPGFFICNRSAEEWKAGIGNSAGEPHGEDWGTACTFPIQREGEDEPSRYLVLRQFRQSIGSEEGRSAIGWRSLDAHLRDTEQEVVRLAHALQLPDELTDVLRIAARNHDQGKDCDRWQNAFCAPTNGRPYAKTPGPCRSTLLEGYRHEFGSLPAVERDGAFATLSDESRELALHLVAAHHGFGRPVIRVNSCDDAPPSILADRARDVALRFARAQKLWGPWGLAWLESIVRAADHRASALVDDEQGRMSDREKEAAVYG